MLVLTRLAAAAGARTLFQGLDLAVNPGEVAGIVGPNGSGKSTLLRIAAGLEPPLAGTITLLRGVQTGYLPQDATGGRSGPVSDAFPRAFLESAESEVARLAEQLAAANDPAESTRIAANYERAIARLTEAGDPPGAAHSALGLRQIDPAEPVERLSGGERSRLALLDLLAADPDVLLLDEPTNHLDIEGIRWLEGYLQQSRAPAIVVSHDRAFLDAVATVVVALDPIAATATVYPGGYSAYAAERERQLAEQWEAYRRQQREERQLRRNISAIESRARGIENRTIDFHYRKRAKKVARQATVLKSRLERAAGSGGRIERPGRSLEGPKGQFAAPDRGATRVLAARGLSFAAGGATLIDDASFEIHRGDRVCLVGPNGSGKTTLLRAILGRHPVAAGSLELARSAATGYLGQDGPVDGTLGATEPADTPLDIVRRWQPMTAAEATNFLHWFFFTGEQIRTPLASLSFGELQRLALGRFFLEPCDLLLLDEPANHLDIPARESFEQALDSFDGAALVVTHDRHFVERYAELVLRIDGTRLRLESPE